jgi:hypothetical protein
MAALQPTNIILGDFQAHNTPGFIFGAIFAPLCVLLGAGLTYAIGRTGNDKYKYSIPTRFPKLLALWRLTCFVFGLVTIGVSVAASNVW